MNLLLVLGRRFVNPLRTFCFLRGVEDFDPAFTARVRFREDKSLVLLRACCDASGS